VPSHAAAEATVESSISGPLLPRATLCLLCPRRVTALARGGRWSAGGDADAPVRDLVFWGRRLGGASDTRSSAPQSCALHDDPVFQDPRSPRVSGAAPGAWIARMFWTRRPLAIVTSPVAFGGRRPKSTPRLRTGSGLCSHARRAEARCTIRTESCDTSGEWLTFRAFLPSRVRCLQVAV
jgi:hypothetical protein